ncbi:endonuclease/exonuclease/phosphatase family protein [mine drainage metagenome]|uniref:Endonuclease/exonuclease/phosphatase family protein n=1 Tax=mine drainage metagenome TaxID=410659 RepID=A0A1J5SLT2_9ZZZZ
MAKNAVRKTSKKIFVIINLIIVVLFLSACLSPWLNPAQFWWIGFLGLLIPYFILILLFSVIFWLIAKPKLALISAVTLLIGWQQISVLLAFHTKNEFEKTKNKNGIRIVDWNVESFNGLSKNKAIKKHIREDIAGTITDLEPDIICLQEFNSTNHLNTETNNIALFAQDYPYYYFSKDYKRSNGAYNSGCIIFSKYPFIDSGRIKYRVAESLIYADVVKEKDTFRIYTTHLQSFKFKKEDYDGMDKIMERDEDALAASKNIFYKMKLAFKRRGAQAKIVDEAMAKSPYPSIICGDFNDVPNSYTYFHIKKNRQDVFLKKGFGIGRSFIALAPTLRIDYILPDNNFNIQQFDMVDEGLSDHIMLVTDLSLKK